MVKALFDTNILIDYLHGQEQADRELRAFQGNAISIITWMEVMVGATEAQEAATALFLATFQVIPVDDEVARGAVALRKIHRMKLPDAIIWASAQTTNRLLVTRNSKDFPAGHPGVRTPYQL